MKQKINEMETVEALKIRLRPGIAPHQFVILLTVTDLDTNVMKCIEFWKGFTFKKAISMATKAKRGKAGALRKLAGIKFNGYEVKCIDLTRGVEIYRKPSLSNKRMREIRAGKV